MNRGLTLAVCLALAPRLAHADDERIEQAVTAYGALELERAQELVETVLASRPGPSDQARVLVLRALLRYQGSDPERGRADLAAALEIDPAVRVPGFAPPSVRDAFDELQRSRAAAPPPSPPARAPAIRPPPRVDRPAPPRPAPRRTRGWTSRPWVWSMGGTGVAALAAGAGMLWAVSTRAEIEEQPHEQPELSTLTTRFETGRTIAIVGSVVGAGLLALTALLLYLDLAD